MTQRTATPVPPRDIEFDGDACPRCLGLSMGGEVLVEMVMPLPPSPWAPLARDGSGPCCFDCAAADSLWSVVLEGKHAYLNAEDKKRDADVWFRMARVAVGNDRLDQFRLPGMPMGLVFFGLVAPSQPGDMMKHFAWLDSLPYFTRFAEEGEDG